ncbi:MAG: hypothetical protein WCO18_00725 [bacterium]
MPPTQTQNNSRVLRWSLIIAIVILLNLFYNYTLSLVFSAPEYNNFCSSQQVNTNPQTQNECTSSGGSWTSYPKPSTPDQASGFCDTSYTCRKNFDDSQKAYDKNVFISLIALGVITFAAALIFRSSEVLSVALSLGSVLDLVIASIRYWGNANSLLKVLILGVALAVLIYLAIKKFGNKIQQ